MNGNKNIKAEGSRGGRRRGLAGEERRLTGCYRVRTQTSPSLLFFFFSSCRRRQHRSARRCNVGVITVSEPLLSNIHPFIGPANI